MELAVRLCSSHVAHWKVIVTAEALWMTVASWHSAFLAGLTFAIQAGVTWPTASTHQAQLIVSQFTQHAAIAIDTDTDR
jgi:hypothetical protein